MLYGARMLLAAISNVCTGHDFVIVHCGVIFFVGEQYIWGQCLLKFSENMIVQIKQASFIVAPIRSDHTKHLPSIN